MGFVNKFIGNITGSNQAANGAQAAAATQSAAAGQGIASLNNGLGNFNQLLAPYLSAGTAGLSGQQNLLGLNGAGAQSAAIGGIQNGPQYQALQTAGNNALLQNASATGGLRGGNIEGALAQFNQGLLGQQIQQQYSNYGGLAGIGSNAVSSAGAAQLGTASSIAQLLQQQGAATAGGQIANGNTTANNFGNLLKIGSSFAGAF